MIKQSWNIDTEEVKRILMMHENATKNLYLINEQQKIKVGEKTTTTGKEISLDKKSYPSGLYSIEKLGEGKKDLDSKLQEIAQFAKANNGTQLNIQIEVGESKVTNFDNELKKPLGQGELAKLRGEKLQQYLTNYFQGLVESGYLTTMPNIPKAQTNVELGTQKYDYVKLKDDPKDVKYLEDQYVKFKISLSATKTEDIYDCLVNLVIDVSYYNKPDAKFRCRGGHNCNNAEFELYIDNVLLGIANLNNSGCGEELSNNPSACDRTAQFTVTNEMVQKIVSNPKWNKKTLILSTRCVSSTNCHTSVQEVRIVNGTGTEIYHDCVNPQSARGNTSQKILAVLDKCGMPIKGTTDDNVSAEEIQSLSDQVNTQNNEKLTEIINTQGLTVVPNTTGGTNFFPENSKKLIISNIQSNKQFLTVTYNIKSPMVLGYFINPFGGSKPYKHSFKGNETVKINFQIQPSDIPERRLKKYEERGMITKVPNFNGYNVDLSFNEKGVEYPSNVIIVSTNEQ
jgi:hypothetical protein